MKEPRRICHRSSFRGGLFRQRRGYLRAMLAPVIVAAVAFGADIPCRAGLIIEAPNLTVTPGSSGSFDVLITSTGGAFSVAGDDIELTLTGLSSVSFTGISIDTVTPYIYGRSRQLFPGLRLLSTYRPMMSKESTSWSRAVPRRSARVLPSACWMCSTRLLLTRLAVVSAPSGSARIRFCRTPPARPSRSRLRVDRSPLPRFPSPRR